MQRKDFIKTLSFGLASLPCHSFSNILQFEDDFYDVVIIGAGLSGLNAGKN